MSWRDNLQDASFRGIPFKVINHSLTGGRRIKETERWQERTITTDMGPVLPKFQVSAYIIQNTDNGMDYFHNRDSLINVLQNNTDKDKYNVGTLIHPFYGKRRVHPATYSVSESFNEGGICRFEIEFLLEETELFPGSITDPAAKMDAVVKAANNLSIDSFLNLMSTTKGFIEDIGIDIVQMLGKIQQAVNSVNGVIRSAIATATGIITEAINLINTVLDAPCDLYETMQSAAESFQHLCGMAGDIVQGGVLGGCSGTARGEQVTLDGTTIPEALGQSIILQMIQAQEITEDDLPIASAEQADNRTVIINAIRYMLLSFACRVFVRIQFSSRQQLINYLNQLLDALDALLLRLGEQTDLDVTDLYVAIEQLRASVAALMLEKANNLQSELNISVGNVTKSTLEIAYDLYEDTDRCSEVFNRNMLAIRHPGFVPENTEISVLES